MIPVGRPDDRGEAPASRARAFSALPGYVEDLRKLPGMIGKVLRFPTWKRPAVGRNRWSGPCVLVWSEMSIRLANAAVRFDLKDLTMVWTDHVESTLRAAIIGVECLVRFEISRLNMSGGMVHDELAKVCDLLPCPGITIHLDDCIRFVWIPVGASAASKNSV